jgi:hypothetical protein
MVGARRVRCHHAVSLPECATACFRAFALHRLHKALPPGAHAASSTSSPPCLTLMLNRVLRQPEEPWHTLRGPDPDIPPWVKNPPPKQDGSNPDVCSAEELQRRADHRLLYAEYLRSQHTLHFKQQEIYVRPVSDAHHRDDDRWERHLFQACTVLVRRCCLPPRCAHSPVHTQSSTCTSQHFAWKSGSD